MTYRLIGDSCSDLDFAQRNNPNFYSVPLTLQIGDYTILDDEKFDRKDFIRRVSESSIAAKTACPSPDLFMEAFDCEAENIFVITISEHLSGTYQSAILAKQMFEEERKEKKNILVLSSHSASAGQYRILVELERLCESGLDFDSICKKITEFRDNMKTYFVLETLENLRKSGRLSSLSAFFATKLNIKPIMGAVEGKIVKLDHARGINKALLKMVEIAVKDAGNDAHEKIVAISECNNSEIGAMVAEAFRKAAKFKDVLVTKTAGVATVYAGDGGIVIGIG